MESKKRGGWWALWCVAALMVLIVAYPLSIGPALWGYNVLGFPSERMFNTLYGPLVSAAPWLPHPMGNRYLDYANWWVPDPP